MQDPTAMPNFIEKELMNPINSFDFPSYPRSEPNFTRPTVQNPFVIANKRIFAIANASLLKNEFDSICIVKRNAIMNPILLITVR